MKDAFLQRKQGNFSGAYLLYETILAIFPDNADAHFGIALCRHGVDFGTADGKTTVGILNGSPFSFLHDMSYLRACEFASDDGKRNFALFAEAVQKEKNAVLRYQDMKVCDVIICCAEGRHADGTAFDALRESETLAERFKKQGLTCTVVSAQAKEMNKQQRAEYFNACRTAQVLVNLLNTPEDASAEPVKSLNGLFSSENTRGANKGVYTVMSRDFLPKMTRADRRSGVRIIMSPEDRTELALEVEAKVRDAGHFTKTVPLPVDGGRFDGQIRRAFKFISIGEFDAAEDILNSVILDEPSEVSALWGLFLCKNRAKSARDVLAADAVSGREILGRLLRFGTEGTVGWVKKFIKALSFNIHIKFLAAFKHRDRTLAEKYAEQFSSLDNEDAINDAHRVMLLSLGGSAQALLPGAVLACFSYYRRLPFAAGAGNIASVVSFWEELRAKEERAILRAFDGIDGGAEADYDRLLLENIKVFCEPAAAFERHVGTGILPAVPFATDTAAGKWFYVAQLLELRTEKPNARCEKMISECFANAAKASPEAKEIFDAASSRRRDEAQRDAERNAPKGAQQLIAKAASVLAVGEEKKQEGKRGFWQPFWAFILFLLSGVAIASGIVINMRPDSLLRFNRAMFVSLSVGILSVFCIAASTLSVMLFRARHVRRHTAVGRSLLASIPFGTVTLSVAAVCLAVVSAATFSDRLPVIYLSNIQEFMYLENYPAGNFKLISDIDLGNHAINHLKRFSGTFDGNGHTISNFYAYNNIIDKNTGEIRNVILADSGTGGLLHTNNGVVENVTVKNMTFHSAMITTNHASVKNCVTENCTVRSGAMIKNNIGTVSGVRVINSEVVGNVGGVCVLGDTNYVGGFVGINEGIAENCSVSKLSVESSVAKTHVGGVFGINIGTVSGVVASDISLGGKAVAAGLFAARNTGSVSQVEADGTAVIEVERSFGGFAGENTKQLTACKCDILAEVTLSSDSEPNSYSGGFVGYSSGTAVSCVSSGKLYFTCKTNEKTVVYSGGAIGLAEGRTSLLQTEASVFVTCIKALGNTESSLGGVFGCLKNTSAEDIARSGRFITVITDPESEEDAENAAKYQPKYRVGGFAGSVITDKDHKNETISRFSVDGTVRVNAKKRTFVDFGSVIGYANCDSVVTEGIVGGAYGVRSDGYDKVRFDVIIGRADAIEQVVGVAFSGLVSESGTKAGSIGFTGGADGAFSKCYARDNCGTSAVGAEYVPQEVFFSESFYTDTLGWKGHRWRYAQGSLPELAVTQ